MSETTYKIGNLFSLDALQRHVEGFRLSWRENLLSNYPRPKEPPNNRVNYLSALKVLSAAFSAPAEQRAMPVARFQHQMDATIRMMEQAVTIGSIIKQPHYTHVHEQLPVGRIQNRHNTLNFAGFIVKEMEGDAGPEELYGYFYYGKEDDTWAFRIF